MESDGTESGKHSTTDEDAHIQEQKEDVERLDDRVCCGLNIQKSLLLVIVCDTVFNIYLFHIN